MALIHLPPAQELKRQRARITGQFEYDRRILDLSCKFLVAGRHQRNQPEQYAHPRPLASRLFYFLSGSARIETAQKTISLKKRQWYLLPAKMPFTVFYSKSDLIYIHCDIRMQRFINPFPMQIIPFTQIEPLHFFNKEPLVNHHLPLTSYLCGSMYATFCHLLEENYEYVNNALDKNQYFIQIQEVCSQMPAAEWSVGTIAHEIGCSRSALSKRFQRHMGVSLKSWLSQEIIDLAQQLLLYSDLPINRIAQELGYNESNYFYRFFKKHCQQTPSEFRTLAQRT